MNQPLPISCRAIVVEDGAVWMCQNERGDWELPGGPLEAGEQPEATAARELRDEVGITVEVGAPVATHVHLGTLVLIHYCTFKERTGEQSGEFKGFTKDKIDDLPMPVFYKQAIRAALKGKRL